MVTLLMLMCWWDLHTLTPVVGPTAPTPPHLIIVGSLIQTDLSIGTVHAGSMDHKRPSGESLSLSALCGIFKTPQPPRITVCTSQGSDQGVTYTVTTRQKSLVGSLFGLSVYPRLPGERRPCLLPTLAARGRPGHTNTCTFFLSAGDVTIHRQILMINTTTNKTINQV